jgi:glycerol-1-phosphatase
VTALAARFDTLVLDLDGTVYLGHQPIEFVAESIAAAERLGARPVYVTNNASRPPAEVAAQLAAMGLPATPEDVLTSPQAACRMLVDRHPLGSAVLVVGATALMDEVARVGLRPVRTLAERPVAVVQGHSPDTGWRILAEACLAIRGGADWVAANVDATLPTDRGLLPGNGAMVAALRAATGAVPRVAGKPERPLIDAAIARFGAHRPLAVGDRLDTDIEAAGNAGIPSLLVFTGVCTPAELLVAPPKQRPAYLGFDLRALVDDSRVVDVETGGADWQVSTDDHSLTLSRTVETAPRTDADHLHALAALLRASWANPAVAGVRAGDEHAWDALGRLGIPVLREQSAKSG